MSLAFGFATIVLVPLKKLPKVWWVEHNFRS